LAALVLLGIALFIGGALRLYRLDLIDFRFDQAFPLQYAIDITQGRLWAVQPHGSVAAHLPVYLYLMALPYLVTGNFLAIVSFRILLDVISIALCWWIGARYINWRVGSIAALLYAVAPWAIQSARNTAVESLPLFTAILIIGLFELIQRRNPWGMAISGLGLALSIGNHLAGMYLVPVALMGWWFGRRSIRRWPVALALPPLLLLGADYLLYDAAHGFENIHSLLSNAGKPAQLTGDALQYALWLSGGTHISDLTAQAYGHWIAQVPAFLTGLDTLQVLVLLCGITVLVISGIVLAVRRLQGRQMAPLEVREVGAMLLALIWWAVPIVLQLRHSQPMLLHYLLPTLPAPFLLMAYGVDTVFRLSINHVNVSPVRRTIGFAAVLASVCAVGATCAWQVTTTLRLDAFVERYDTSNGYGQPVKSALQAVEKAKQARSAGITGDVVVVIKDYMTPWNEPGLTLHVLLADIPHRYLNSNVPGWVFRPEGVSYVFAPGTEGLLQELEHIVGPSGIVTSEVPIRDSLSTGFIYARVSQMPNAGQFIQARPARWDNGLELAGYRIISGTTSLRVETLLHVLQNQPENVDYHWYNHVFAGNQQVAQKDDSGIHPISWRSGDYLLMRFDVPLAKPLPASDTHVRIGCYLFPTVHGVLVSQEGKPPDDGVNLVIAQ
jgi:hypothetical protein